MPGKPGETAPLFRTFFYHIHHLAPPQQGSGGMDWLKNKLRVPIQIYKFNELGPTGVTGDIITSGVTPLPIYDLINDKNLDDEINDEIMLDKIQMELYWIFTNELTEELTPEVEEKVMWELTYASRRGIISDSLVLVENILEEEHMLEEEKDAKSDVIELRETTWAVHESVGYIHKTVFEVEIEPDKTGFQKQDEVFAFTLKRRCVTDTSKRDVGLLTVRFVYLSGQ